jgi:hypothetical protein
VTNEVQLLNEAIDQFQSEQHDGVISVSRVINPLLGIWQLANDIDHSVAVPIEHLLTALTGREITTPQEIAETMDATRVELELLAAV